ncbi:MAG: hypothetical protein ABIR68_11020 [Ilumatobacteraceae bacterium]
MSEGEIDPAVLSLTELRDLRARLQHDDDAISFVRRLAQGRLDLVRAKERQLAAGGAGPITDSLAETLAQNISGGVARPPRPADDFSDHPLCAELDDLDDRVDGGDVEAMDAAALSDYAVDLQGFEQARSEERKRLFTQIDALSEELVRRYQNGEADLDEALAED